MIIIILQLKCMRIVCLPEIPVHCYFSLIIKVLIVLFIRKKQTAEGTFKTVEKDDQV